MHVRAVDGEAKMIAAAEDGAANSVAFCSQNRIWRETGRPVTSVFRLLDPKRRVLVLKIFINPQFSSWLKIDTANYIHFF